MNRLRNHWAYLSGPIDRNPNLGLEWRDHITKELKERYGTLTYNPLKKPFHIAGEDNREQRHEWKRNGRYDLLAEFMRKVVHADLRLVDRSDFLIANLEPHIHSVGTIDEICLAASQQKPVLIVADKSQIGDWIYGRIKLKFIFSNFEEMFHYLDYVDSAPEIDDLGKWIFFDQPKPEVSLEQTTR